MSVNKKIQRVPKITIMQGTFNGIQQSTVASNKLNNVFTSHQFHSWSKKNTTMNLHELVNGSV